MQNKNILCRNPCQSTSTGESQGMDGIRSVLYTMTIIVYAYLVCMILAVAAELLYLKDIPSIYRNINYIHITTKSVQFQIRSFTNAWFLLILCILVKCKFPVVCHITKSLGVLKRLEGQKLGKVQKIGTFLTFWLTILNLLLIVITNPSIKNPGPVSEDLTVLYQNARGFVPFNALGKNILPLDNDKLIEFQAHIFEKKPCLVILNETWLAKEHLDNEIFPNDSYRCFRVDRSLKTHPIDPNNLHKFKKRGGGIMIAMRSDLSVVPKKISISSKAEILSLELNINNKDIICLTTCYRVGTLGCDNHKEIDNHLRTISRNRKYHKHIVVGDFNLSNTSWAEKKSTEKIENLFIDTFNDLGLSQLVCHPTHEKGKILDLVLSSKSELIRDVTILNKDSVCHSDHFGITFKICTKVKKIVTKRKTYINTFQL